MTEFIPPGTRFIDLPSPFPMRRGGEIHHARVAYETWGTLSPARDNALLIATGLASFCPLYAALRALVPASEPAAARRQATSHG